MKKTTRKAGTFSLKRLFAGGPEVRLSIRVKMALYMLAIFLSMLLIMNFFIAQNISQGNERYINDDLVTMKNNGLIYVKQMLVLSQQNNNEEGFAAIAQDLVEEISGATGNPTAAFTMDGQMLAATNSAVFIENNFGDVSLARGGLSAAIYGREGRSILPPWASCSSSALSVCFWAESQGNPALADIGLDQAMGSMEGKEVRFGIAQSAMFTTVTTSFTTGTVNNMHDTLTPLGGMILCCT